THLERTAGGRRVPGRRQGGHYHRGGGRRPGGVTSGQQGGRRPLPPFSAARRARGIDEPRDRVPGLLAVGASEPGPQRRRRTKVTGPPDSGKPRHKLAEGVGFEPTVPGGTHALQACLFGRSSTLPYAVEKRKLAEGVGFEPTRRVNRLTHFECAAFGRSATPPYLSHRPVPALMRAGAGKTPG